MKFLEVRRHTLTKKGTERELGSRISAEGVELARQVGSKIGPCEYVAVSLIPRTLETALAMGFAVDELLDMDAGMWGPANEEVAHHEQWDWPQAFAKYAEVMAKKDALATFAQHQRDLWIGVLDHVSKDGQALVVAHGGLIEPGLVACLPDAEHVSWGGPFSHCEGFRVSYEAGHFVDVEFRRV